MEATLVSVLEHRPTDCEILLVLNSPYEDPYSLSDEVTFIQAPTGASRVACLNLAIKEVHSPYISILSPGVTVNDGWAEAAIGHFVDPRVAAIAPVIRNVNDHEEIIAAGWAYDASTGPTPIPCEELMVEQAVHHMHGLIEERRVAAPHCAAAFYRTLAIELIGGQIPTDVGNTLSEIDLGLILNFVGYKTISSNQVSVMMSPAATLPSESESSYAAGLHSARLFWRNISLASWSDILLRHPIQIVGNMIGGLLKPRRIGHALGRMRALLGVMKSRHHQDHLVDMRLACEALLQINRATYMRIDPAQSISRGTHGRTSHVDSTSSSHRKAA